MMQVQYLTIYAFTKLNTNELSWPGAHQESWQQKGESTSSSTYKLPLSPGPPFLPPVLFPDLFLEVVALSKNKLQQG